MLLRLAAVAASFYALLATAHSEEQLQGVEAVGTELRLRLPGMRVLAGADLVGAKLTIVDARGGQQLIRVDAVEPDPTDEQREIQLYTLSVQEPANGTWSNFCAPGSDGVAKAFPLSGIWTGDGRHVPDEKQFSLICTGGAIGKCVRWGYKPWKTTPAGQSLWAYHQACVRMVRADYGGDGIGHTRDDTPIDFFDQLNIAEPALDPGKLTFEAAWSPDGAVCVRKPRITEMISLEELERMYPRLKGRTGADCNEVDALPGILLRNRS